MTPPTDVEEKIRFGWLLGQQRYQRLCLRFWLMTSSVYLVVFSLLLFSVPLGMIDATATAWVITLSLLGISVFYLLLRSGWSMARAEPALTSQQMAFAFVMLSVVYVLAPKLRQTLMIIMPLVLMFGAFTLTPRRCREMGVLAVLAQGIAIAWGVLRYDDDDSIGDELLLFACAAVVYTMAADMAGRLSAMRQQLRSQKRSLAEALATNAQMARQDDLTGLPNRRHAMEMMEYESRRAKREKLPPCVCMIDLDHFKRINDTHGHAAGDFVLQTFARVAQPALRAPDILARWGGEEFLLLMPETAPEEAAQVLQRLRDRLSEPGLWQDFALLQVRFSAGVATLSPSETLHDALRRADAALYQAKQNGRDRSELAEAGA